jgi:hypothetical protein
MVLSDLQIASLWKDPSNFNTKLQMCFENFNLTRNINKIQLSFAVMN